LRLHRYCATVGELCSPFHRMRGVLQMWLCKNVSFRSQSPNYVFALFGYLALTRCTRQPSYETAQTRSLLPAIARPLDQRMMYLNTEKYTKRENMKKICTAILITLLTVATYAQSPHAPQLYGMTQYGGNSSKGSIFHYTPSTKTFTTDYHFQVKVKGKTPKCEIVAGNNGKYYGTTTTGGDYNAGVLFEWDSTTSVYKDLYNFTGNDGKDARGGMVLYNNKLYGMTNEGGANNYGVIYEWDIATNTYTKKIDLENAIGSNPTGSLTLLNNIFYGFTSSGGAYDKGVLFEWNPATNVYTKKFDFDSIKGSNPVGKLTFFNGKFYAMCNQGGAFNVGTIYKWDVVNNIVTKTFDFNNTRGAFPTSGLTLYNNKFYGTTYEGGIYQTGLSWQHFGVIFEYNPANDAFVKKRDLGFQGGFRGPMGSLVMKDNVFWCATIDDAASKTGGIFTWNPATNQIVNKYGFSVFTQTPCEIERPSLGKMPFETMLVSGNFLIGTFSEAAGNMFGTLFKYSIDANQMVSLVNMEATTGAYPKGSLTKLGNKLYGLTFQGGNAHAGNIFEWDFKTNQFTERFQFDGYTTGIWPKGSLTWYNGKFYGINSLGKLKFGGGFVQRELGDYFSWDPATNIYQSLLSANYARCTPVLLNNKLYTTTEVSLTTPFFSAINAFDPTTNTLTEVALMNPNVGTFSHYQGVEGANGLTYYNGKFYGMTTGKYGSGGSPFRGAIYEWDTTTNAMILRYDFVDSLGTYPTGNLLLVGNEFYGIASNYGNFSGSYACLFKWNPATNVYTRKNRIFGDYPFGTPTLSGGKIYLMKEGAYLELLEYDPVSDTTIILYNESIPLFQTGNWNYTNCTRPPSYTQLLEVIPNEDPILLSFPNTQTICSNQNYTTTFTISDADKDTMNFQIESSNIALIPIANISITNIDSVYTINYTSANNQTGTTTISITALDGYGGTVNFTFIVNVNASPNIGITQSLATLTANQTGANYQWINCSDNSAIAGANSQSYTATTAGDYAVAIITNNCADTSACISVPLDIVGVLEPTNDNSFFIYPNPTSGQFTISLSTDEATITITDLLGQQIIKTQTTQKTTTLQLDNNGLYIVYVKIKQGTTTQKLIVNR
jgi:uncharacterized repeat protein (TIGR03803 family)